MTLKQYQTARALVAMFLAMVVSYSVVINNLAVAAGAIAVGIGVSLFLRTRVKDVVADERDYVNAGTAARYTLSIFSVLGAILSLYFMFMRDGNALYQTLGATLSYTVCAVLLTHSLIYTFLNRTNDYRAKMRFFFVAAILAIFVIIAGLRLFTPEDTWICNNGAWVAHGHPTAPMPTESCK